MHKTIFIRDLGLSFPSKHCFEDFFCEIPYGSRIAIIGRNGSGKTSLLKVLAGKLKHTQGNILNLQVSKTGYVPQIVEDFDSQSGSELLNRAISKSLQNQPDILLLDEPTNHLDKDNRSSLMRMLNNFTGTLIVVSHDKELLSTCIDSIWHIENTTIKSFHGQYEDYIHEIKQQRNAIERQLLKLKQDRKDTHNALVKEQQRAAKSKTKGRKSIDKRKWPTVVSKAKAQRAETTSGRKKTEISATKQKLTKQLQELQLPEAIMPTFRMPFEVKTASSLVSLSNACLSYNRVNLVLQNVNLTVNCKDRVAIVGKNASGKTTLLKGILNHTDIIRSGDWHMPAPKDIGYLDQHYSNLDPNLTVYETIQKIVPSWTQNEIRQHLNTFLFRKNHEVNAQAHTLSGGEKARLSLAVIAARPPKLLILDEVTNNLDIETYEHVVEVLQKYPGTLLAVSHDEEFLHRIGIQTFYKIENKKLT